MGADSRKSTHIVAVLLIFLFGGAHCVTNPNDFKILNDFRNGLENPDLLRWPAKNNDPCGPPSWPHVLCSNDRVTQIQVQGLGLRGSLTQNLNQLEKLQEIDFQRNYFTGKLPSFSGLSDLQIAYLDFNEFDTIPADFFHGLGSVRVLAMDNNPFNQSTGWTIPDDLADSTKLVNFSCSNCNIVGRIPDFFGRIGYLSSLRLSSNRLSGEIPSSFRESLLQVLWLNNQDDGGLTGSIDVIGNMVSLTRVWLHGNQFTGPIPDNIGSLLSLRELNLNRNRLVGLIPRGLTNLDLQFLDLDDNMFMGPIPMFNEAEVSYESNSFCQADPGVPCAPEVSALLDFLHDVNYPERLASEWKGNDPCVGPWWGISCNSMNQVSIINLQNLGLNGTLSSSLVNLPSLVEIHLEGNQFYGTVPANLTLLESLRLLNLSGNNIQLPLPKFRDDVKVITYRMSATDGPLPTFPNGKSGPSAGGDSSPDVPPDVNLDPDSQQWTKSRVAVIVASVVGSGIFTLLAILLAVYCLKKRKGTSGDVVIHPKNSYGLGDMYKIAKVDSSALESQNGSSCVISITNGLDNAPVLEARGLIFSLQNLRTVTNNFSQENELGRGGFGVVYKGKLEDGTELAVKRMEVGVINGKAVGEFQTEISVLSRVRHRHLVSLLGYSVEGNERLLVYEYMPQGALSQHLFHWKSLNLQPLSWKKRLNIALDVARGVEYLHTLAQQSFIHRDLKSANILLDDDFRAKVSDFGLVKLALDTERSPATRLAGTFGYLAPEYAVTGKITTKVDVFSFGVVLMELLTGLVAVDERRPEEKQYLVEWFWQIKSNRETLIASMDPALEAKEDIYQSICITAELAGLCTSRDPSSRPEMGYMVNVLSQLVETWKPYQEMDQYTDITTTLPLPQLLKSWKEEDSRGGSWDSRGSIPPKSSGFADSFASADAR